MDDFIRSLSLTTNTILADVIEPCAKILLHLDITADMNVTYNEIELLLKAATFVDECITLFGKENLKESLIEKYPFYEPYFEMLFFKKLNEKISCVVFVCTQILQTENGHRHIFFLDKLLKALKDLSTDTSDINKNNPISSITENVFSIDNVSTCLYPNEREQMLKIVQRIFQLPIKEIDKAIKRVLEYLPFEIIGYIFIESKCRSFYARCIIMVNKICNYLINEESDGAPAFFLHTMHKTTAVNSNGLEFFWKCLKNQIFANSLSEMLILYLKSLLEIDDEIKFETKHIIYQNYNFDAILYLIHCCTMKESPIRRTFYKKLHNANLSKNLLYLINEVQFVYE